MPHLANNLVFAAAAEPTPAAAPVLVPAPELRREEVDGRRGEGEGEELDTSGSSSGETEAEPNVSNQTVILANNESVRSTEDEVSRYFSQCDFIFTSFVLQLPVPSNLNEISSSEKEDPVKTVS